MPQRLSINTNTIVPLGIYTTLVYPEAVDVVNSTGARGLALSVYIASYSGSTPPVLTVNSVSSSGYIFPIASITLPSAAGTYFYLIYPGIVAGTVGNQTNINSVVTPKMTIIFTAHDATNGMTVGIDGSLLI